MNLLSIKIHTIHFDHHVGHEGEDHVLIELKYTIILLNSFNTKRYKTISLSPKVLIPIFYDYGANTIFFYAILRYFGYILGKPNTMNFYTAPISL